MSVVASCFLIIAGLLIGSVLRFWISGNKVTSASIFVFICSVIVLALGMRLTQLLERQMKKKDNGITGVDRYEGTDK